MAAERLRPAKRKHALSDWMAIEKDRGISVTSIGHEFDIAGCE